MSLMTSSREIQIEYPVEFAERGERNLSAIERIVVRQYRRDPAFNRQLPFVNALLADIIESGEVLDVSEIAGAPLSH